MCAGWVVWLAVKIKEMEPTPRTDTHGEWRQVPGIDPEKLMISSHGYVKTRITRGYFASPTKGKPDNNGYMVVHIDQKAHRIHRLVCLVWHGECPKGMTCDHINGDRADNRASNLRWINSTAQRLNQKAPARKQWEPDKIQNDLPEEEWKVVTNAMRISNMGRVQFKKPHHFDWSPKRTPRPTSGMGYARTNNKMVHRIVYEAFKGTVPEGLTIDHINQNKHDNRLSNLRAVNKVEQNKNRTFKHISKRQQSLKKPVNVQKIGKDKVEHFESIGDAVRALTERTGTTFRSGCASLVAQGKQKHHLRYVFSFV